MQVQGSLYNVIMIPIKLLHFGNVQEYKQNILPESLNFNSALEGNVTKHVITKLKQWVQKLIRKRNYIIRLKGI